MLTFREAADTAISFGKHKGRTLDQIGETDEGLLYLDWLRGQKGPTGFMAQVLKAYLDDPSISKAVKEAIACQ